MPAALAFRALGRHARVPHPAEPTQPATTRVPAAPADRGRRCACGSRTTVTVAATRDPRAPAAAPAVPAAVVRRRRPRLVVRPHGTPDLPLGPVGEHAARARAAGVDVPARVDGDGVGVVVALGAALPPPQAGAVAAVQLRDEGVRVLPRRCG